MTYARRALLVLSALPLLILGACQGSDNTANSISISSSLTSTWTEAPVRMGWPSIQARVGEAYPLLSLGMSGSELPYQLDDLTGDGIPDELFFLVDIPAGQAVEVALQSSEMRHTYPSRTQAVLAVRQGGRFNEEGLYVDGSDYVPVTSVEVPTEQEQDSDWAMFEGPVWESDLVGFRYYLDDRFRTDIFGKSTSELALQSRQGNYHEISEWGADVLHVGTSLGLGSPALVTENGLALVDNAERRMVEVVASGPLRSILRTNYWGWKVGDLSIDFISELEIHAGQRWTEQRLSTTGLPDSARFATGIVRHSGAPDLYSGEVDDVLYAYTWGIQSDQGHLLGMAVLVPSNLNPVVNDTDSETHVVTFDAPNGAASYRYLAAWELENHPIPDRDSFEEEVRLVASQWSGEITTELR